MNWFESAMDFTLALIAENVYPGVFLAAILETVIPIIPSELVFPVAGYSILDAGMAEFHILGVGLAGGSGATVGAYCIFIVVQKAGRPGLRRFVLTSEKTVDRAEKWFSKYGDKSVLLGRCVPGIRELVSVPAGLLSMKTPKFLVYTFIGSCAWSIALTAAGYYFGEAFLHDWFSGG